MYDNDRRNGGRARSARIRREHDYEATQLESMRRRRSGGEGRTSLVVRLASALLRLRGQTGSTRARAGGEDTRSPSEPEVLVGAGLGE